MSNYIDLVLCDQNGSKYLFQAPAWSGLKKGDAVRVATRNGERPADVIAVMTVDKNDDEKMNFAIAATNATLPIKKVISKLLFQQMLYDDEKENEQ